MDGKMHSYQIAILKELLFKPGARFRDINTLDITNDHFTFHLHRLEQDGWIIKKKEKYSLSDKGKELANRLDTDKLVFEKQAKVAVAIHAVRQHNGQSEYLVHQRLKEPFFGWFGTHSGKVRWGETPLECAKREFKEETGLEGVFTHKGIVHYLHTHVDGRLLEDKYFWVYRVEEVTGYLKESVPEGKNIWMDEHLYRAQAKVFATFEELQEVFEAPELVYLERVKVVEEY